MHGVFFANRKTVSGEFPAEDTAAGTIVDNRMVDAAMRQDLIFCQSRYGIVKYVFSAASYFMFIAIQNTQALSD